MKDGLYQATMYYLCAGFVIENGVVTMCAPILQKRIEYWKTRARLIGDNMAQGNLFDNVVVQTPKQGGAEGGQIELLRHHNTINRLSDKPPKRIQITSRESFAEILKTIGKRERLILQTLNIPRFQERPPTSYELFVHLEAKNQALDLNNVRPILTRLKDHGLVKFGPRRFCLITAKKAYTWVFVESIQPTFLSLL